jgi:hypothetical protein
MDYQKVFLGEDYTVRIRCPYCMHERILPFEKLPRKLKFKVRCKCTGKFGVQIEMRKKYRKEVDLTGIFLKTHYDHDDKWRRTLSESQLSGIKPMNCKVRDLSLRGIGLEIPENVKIEQEDHLVIKFTLDNSASTQVEKEAIVKSVIDNRIGCEFKDDGNIDPDLGFYFL